jgi:serine/threonine-protein kinase
VGPYTIVRERGSGGMGVVYEARRDGARAALKVVSSWLVSDVGRQRFRLEAMACAQLTHPNTVHVFDFGETEDGTLYCAMEYLEGLDLGQLVELHGPQSPGRVVRILEQITGALGEAHEKSFVHRDIKPANILLTEGDVAKLVDFGLVMPLALPSALPTPPGGIERLSLEGPVLGTPRYTPPEMALGVGPIGPAADFYALGLVAHFLLTGKHAFDASEPSAILKMQQESRAPDLRKQRPEVSPGLAGAIAWCLEKAPKARPSSATALLAALRVCPEHAAWSQAEADAWWAAHPSAT